MMARLWMYFGVVGVASVAAWLGALVALAAGGVAIRRHRRWTLALVAAMMAVALAQWNSARINAIEVDRSEEEAAARQEQVRLQQDQQAGSGRVEASRIRFAEDTSQDRLDVAGTSREATGQVAVALEPAYRAEGKQAREAGKTKGVIAADLAGDGDVPRIRKLKEADLWRANRMDRMNLAMAQLALILAAVCLAGDYLWRLNQPLASCWPLPIAGPWLDAVFPPRRLLALQGMEGERLRHLLSGLVRRGQSFIVLGSAAPGLPTEICRFQAGRLHGMRFRQIPMGDAALPMTAEFLMDAVWFNRYYAVVGDRSRVDGLSVSIANYLEGRVATHARARSTVNVIWAGGTIPDVLGRLLVSAAEALNLRLILVSGEIPASVSGAGARRR